MKTKNANGITLIALIITIILMLLLAGIVLSLTIGNNGIFKLAKDASKNYINSAKDEENQLENFQNNIDNILKDDNKNYPTLVNKAKVGDYVDYDPTIGVADKNLLSYTSPVGTGMSHGNGCSQTSDGIDLSSGQTFTANNKTKWRILKKDEETGEIVLISEDPIQADNGMDFHIQGAIGYLYVEQELNEICKIYGYGKGADTTKIIEYEIGDAIEGFMKKQIQSGARSIKVEDINPIAGYTPTLGQTYSHAILHPTLTTTSGVSETITTRTDPNTTYEYAISGYLNNTSNIYKMLFRNVENTSSISYWLASRSSWNGSYAVSWAGRYVENEKVTGFEFCNNADFTELPRTHGIRPIVYLKPNIQTKGQDENEVWKLDV